MPKDDRSGLTELRRTVTIKLNANPMLRIAASDTIAALLKVLDDLEGRIATLESERNSDAVFDAGVSARLEGHNARLGALEGTSGVIAWARSQSRG